MFDLLLIRKRATLTALLFLLANFTILAGQAKYIFLCIGDGMGASQRQVAEYYKRHQTGNNQTKLLINSLPVAGITTTHCLDSLVTDSAAAGTAYATGSKTNSGMISMLPNGTHLKTLAEFAKTEGMGTGLVTTTRLTHATPAAFGAHNVSRGNENEIAEDLLTSGFDFYAGGGLRHFVPKDSKLTTSKRKDNRNLGQEFADKGYKTFLNKSATADFRKYQPEKGDKVFASLSSGHLPYEIDRRRDDCVPTLAELTEKAIQLLSKNDKGFFMMVEGGRIDHACHANDAASAIHDTLAFDDAVAKAYDFYQKHPKETLVIVVGDHETGGMGLGFGSGYFLKLDQLDNIKASIGDSLKGKYNGSLAEFYSLLAKDYGLKELTGREKTRVVQALDFAMINKNDKPLLKQKFGSYGPVLTTVARIISQRANLYWTSYAHTAQQLPVSAVGVNAEKFGGFNDNTDIHSIIAGMIK